MSIPDIVIIAMIAAAVFFALRRMIRQRKTGCSCGCANCDRACEARRK